MEQRGRRPAVGSEYVKYIVATVRMRLAIREREPVSETPMSVVPRDCRGRDLPRIEGYRLC